MSNLKDENELDATTDLAPTSISEEPIAEPTPIEAPTPEPVAAPQAQASPQASATPEPPQAPEPSNKEPATAEDFAVEAFITLGNSTDSNQATSSLIDYYNAHEFDKPEEASQVLREYSEKIRQKHKEYGYTDEDVLAIAPIDPEEAVGETAVERINDWEKRNLEAIRTSSSPAMIAISNTLAKNVEAYASRTRRDHRSEGEGLGLWAKDKAFRFLEGAVSPFASAAELDSVNKYIREGTRPSSDEGTAGLVAGAVGEIVPMVGAMAAAAPVGMSLPAAGLVTGIQGAGIAKDMYRSSLETTGDERKAQDAAALMAAGQLVQMVPLLKPFSKVTKSLLTKFLPAAAAVKASENIIMKGGTNAVADGLASKIASIEKLKPGVKDLIRPTLEAGAGGYAGAVLSNIAANVGLDTNGDITRTAAASFLINAGMAGLAKSGHVMLERALMQSFQDRISQVKTVLEKGGDPAKVLAKDAAAISESRDAPNLVGDEAPLKATKKVDAVEESELYLTEEGTVAVRDLPPRNLKQRKAEQERINEEIADWQNNPEEMQAGKLYDDAGMEVVLKSEPDVEVPFDEAVRYEANAYGKGNVFLEHDGQPVTLIDNEHRHSPGLALTTFFKSLGGVFALRKHAVISGALAYATKDKAGNHLIGLLRSLGADPDRLIEATSHEVGHVVKRSTDWLKDITNPVQLHYAQGLVKLYEAMQGPLTRTPMYDALVKVSKSWRGNWDGTIEPPDNKSYNSYRSDVEELFPDTFGAMMNRPDLVQQWSPEAYKLMMDVIDTDPGLTNMWEQLRRFDTNPDEASLFNMAVMKEGRKREAVINNNVEAIREKKKSLAVSFKENMKDLYADTYQKYGIYKKKMKGLPSEVRKVADEIFRNLVRKDMVYHFLESEVEIPLQKLNAEFAQLGIDGNYWAHYAWAKNVTDTVTNTMDNIKNNFDLYHEAGDIVATLLGSEAGVKSGIHGEVLTAIKLADTPDALMDALAKLSLVGDTAAIFPKEDMYKGIDVTDPKAKRKARLAYYRATRELNRRKTSVPIENVRNSIKDLKVKELGEQYKAKLKNLIDDIESQGEDVTQDRADLDTVDPEILGAQLKDAMLDIVQDNAFAVRRYLINPGLNTRYDATRDIAVIEKEINDPAKFAKLKDITERYHQILARTIPMIESSGIFSPDIIRRIKLNKDSYVTTNVIKYYELHPEFDSRVLTALGTISETGNELTSTANKMKVITERAYYQQGVNSAISLAVLSHDATLIDKGRPGFDIYGEKNKLNAKDPDNSYLVGMKEGKTFLYKLNGKGWEKGFQSFDRFEGVPFSGLWNLTLDLSNKITKMLAIRHMKTKFNPAYVLATKYYDRRHEAMWANSFELFLGFPRHLSKNLRNWDKLSLKEATDRYDNNDIHGALRTIVDLDSVITDSLNYQANDVYNADMVSFNRGIAELMGEPPIPQNLSDRIGNWVEHKLDNAPILRSLSRIAQIDELRTKLNGFRIGKEIYGMNDNAAATFSNEKFGIPDPTGGGTAAPLINQMFLFGRAHFNGVRALTDFVIEQPWTAAKQITYRILLPRLLLSNMVAGAAIKQLWGEEEALKFEMINNKLPEYTKISGIPIILGAQDGKGNHINWWDFELGDIEDDWKAWAVSTPQSRELTTMTRLAWPLIRGLMEGRIDKTTGGTHDAVVAELGGNLQPAIQYLVNLFQIVGGKEGPTDWYRGNKNILDKDLVKSGTIPQKLAGYLPYLASSLVPGISPYNPFQTSKPEGTLEKIIQYGPVVGPMVRRFTIVSNFGDRERRATTLSAREELFSDVVNGAGDSTREALRLYAGIAATTSEIAKATGEPWKTQVSPSTKNKAREMFAWHAKYQSLREDIHRAMEDDDPERRDELYEQLEAESENVLAIVKELASELIVASEPSKKK